MNRDKDLMIAYINKIIVNAEINGADAGGTYESNIGGLYKSMRNFLAFMGYDSVYDIIMTDVGGGWSIFQYVKK